MALLKQSSKNRSPGKALVVFEDKLTVHSFDAGIHMRRSRRGSGGLSDAA